MVLELATGTEPTPEDRLLQAEAVVRDWCGWHIAPSRTDTITVDPTGPDLLLLPTLHLTGVTSVTVVGGDLVDPDTYDWTEQGVVRRTGYRAWSYERAARFTVVYTHGFTLAPPAVTAVVQAVANRASSNPGGLLRTQVGPYSEAYSLTGTNQSTPLALLDAERDLLGRYALPPRF